MDPAAVQAELLRRHAGPSFGFVKLRPSVPHSREDVVGVATRWTNVLRTGSVAAKFVAIDFGTLMFTMERGQDLLEGCLCSGHKPMSLQKQPWSDVEKEKLAKGIKQQYQETLILDSMNNGRLIFSSIEIQRKQRSWRKRRLQWFRNMVQLLSLLPPQVTTGVTTNGLEKLHLLLPLLQHRQVPSGVLLQLPLLQKVGIQSLSLLLLFLLLLLPLVGRKVVPQPQFESWEYETIV